MEMKLHKTCFSLWSLCGKSSLLFYCLCDLCFTLHHSHNTLLFQSRSLLSFLLSQFHFLSVIKHFYHL